MAAPPSEILAEIGKSVRDQDFARANALALKAISDGFEHPALFNVQAMWQEQNGCDSEAAEIFRRAEALAPDDPAILNALGLCLTRLRRFGEAEVALLKATKVRPGHALSHYRLGHTLWQAGKLDDAEISLKRAIALDAQLGDALSCLAAVAAAKGDIAAAGSYARRALQRTPNDPLAVSVLAAAELAAGKPEEAARRLQPLLDAPGQSVDVRVMALELQGRTLRAQGRSKDSFGIYASRNALLKSRQPGSQVSHFQQLRDINEFLGRAAPSFWRPGKALPTKREARSHIFLAGFPRSGVEVLGQLLGRHPEITSLHGTDPLAEAAGKYLTSPLALEKLASLEDTQLAAQRNNYWSGVRTSGLQLAGKVFVDASPANAMRLPLIAKLFPDARVIVMQRDPRDVITSCFIELPRMAQVLEDVFDLEAIAGMFDEVARVVRASRDRMSLPLAALKYENLIADPENSLSAACEFAGLEWDRNQFGRRAGREDGFGYGSEQPGMWLSWTDEFSTVLPELQPWIDEGAYARAPSPTGYRRSSSGMGPTEPSSK